MTDTAPETTNPGARTWSVTEALAVDDTRTPDDSEALARSGLSQAIRSEGYVIDHESIAPGEWYPARILADNTLARIEDEDPTPPQAHARVWTARAIYRTTDAEDGTLLPSLIRYDVPEPYASSGGEVRVRHNLDAEDIDVVVEHADGTVAAAPAYFDLDGHQSHVTIHPGTTRLYVSLPKRVIDE